MTEEQATIRQEMDETRDSLTDKICMFEKQVVDTVHEASAGMKETVQAVKDTVQSVKESVGETVDSVKESFSVRYQVEKHPWMVMAGAIGAGFAAGYILNAPAAAPSQPTMVRMPRRNGNGMQKEAFVSPPSDREMPASEGVLDHLTRTFENEINQIKGLAIGTLAGILRDMVVTTVPQMMKSPVNDVFNDITVKLGGQTIQERILSEDWKFRSDDAATDNPSPTEYPTPRQSSYTAR